MENNRKNPITKYTDANREILDKLFTLDQQLKNELCAELAINSINDLVYKKGPMNVIVEVQKIANFFRDAKFSLDTQHLNIIETMLSLTNDVKPDEPKTSAANDPVYRQIDSLLIKLVSIKRQKTDIVDAISYMDERLTILKKDVVELEPLLGTYVEKQNDVISQLVDSEKWFANYTKSIKSIESRYDNTLSSLLTIFFS